MVCNVHDDVPGVATTKQTLVGSQRMTGTRGEEMISIMTSLADRDTQLSLSACQRDSRTPIVVCIDGSGRMLRKQGS